MGGVVVVELEDVVDDVDVVDVLEVVDGIQIDVFHFADRCLDIARHSQIDVEIGVQKPDMVDAAKVGASLPHGQVTVKVVKGGLDVIDKERGGASVIAMATVAVRLDLEKHLGISQP